MSGLDLDLAGLVHLLGTTLRLAVPLIFAALGGVLSERAGVINIGLEGMMLAGAFAAAVAGFHLGDPAAGLVAGALAGALMALPLAALAVGFGANQIVAGIGVNLLAAGLTAFLGRILLGMRVVDARVEGFGVWPIPLLSDLPVLGPILFRSDPVTYLAYLAIPLVWWLLFRTPWGLWVRATGENPRSADVAGVSVPLVRLVAVTASGVLAGIGGAYLVLSQVFVFTEGMTAGKGFIAVAAVILGRWHPVGAVLACLLFGFCDALQLRMQFANPETPYQIFVTLPYLISLLALVGLVGRTRGPGASGRPYRREMR